MNLINQILLIILTMKDVFAQDRIFVKFIKMIFAVLCVPGRHTITSYIFFSKDENRDWSTYYRFFSKQKWQPEVCFDKLAEIALKKALEKYDQIVFSIDDFRIEKTGKTIPHTSYQLDPKSPPFHTNLVWGHRYVHATLIIARKKKGVWQAAKSISVRLKLAPHIKKPGKKATDNNWKEYETLKKEHNQNVYASEIIKQLRELCDKLGYSDKSITIVADGGYCNKTILRNVPERVKLILRCRKDAKLCLKSVEKRKFYDDKKFTPSGIYKDENIFSKTAEVFYGRRTTQIKYKEKGDVYWQRGSQRCPLRCIVIHGVKYRKNKNGYDNYRDPMYLLTTDLTTETETIIQLYIYRWEIEVTHRELKNDMGIGQAQVWNKKSVERSPQLVALANSIVHLAHVMIEEEDNDSNYLSPPKWYKTRKRISLAYLRRRIRSELVENSDLTEFLENKWSWRDIFERIAA